MPRNGPAISPSNPCLFNTGAGNEGGMVEEIADRDENTEEVYLTCIVCGQIEVVHVPSDRKLPPKVYWECLECRNDEPQVT